MKDQPLFTVRETAQRLRVSEKTIRNLLSKGQLSFHRIGAGRGVIRISEEAILAHLQDCQVIGPEATADRPRPRKKTVLRHIKI